MANSSSIYPANTAVSEISASERLMLMTLRLWAIPHHSPHKQCPDWRTGLYQCDAGDQACAAMDAFMNILLSYSARAMDMRCTCNERLGLDEGLFLQMLALLQDNKHWEAQAILADWVPLPVQGMALLCAMHLAEALRKAEIVVPLFTRQPAQIFQFEEFRARRMQQTLYAAGQVLH